MRKVIERLNALNINLTVNGGKIAIKAPKGALTTEIVQLIKDNKAALIEFYQQHRTLRSSDIPSAPLQEDYPLSASQSRIWLIGQMNGGNTAYNMPGIFKISGSIDTSVLQQAFNEVIDRYEILRTNFIVQEGATVRQKILPKGARKLDLATADLVGNPKEDIEQRLLGEVMHTFDLEQGALFKASMLKVADQEYFFSFVIHHSIGDGISSKIILEDVFALYEGYLHQRPIALKKLRFQYKDYACWEQSDAQKAIVEQQKKYWAAHFEGEIPILDLGLSRPPSKSYRGSVMTRKFGAAACSNFNTYCKQREATSFMVLMTLTNILLSKYSGQSDIVIGYPVSGREHEELQEQVGLFSNTLGLKTSLREGDTFNTVLERTKQNIRAALKHQNYPFDALIGDLGLVSDRSHHPLFDVMVSYQKEDSLQMDLAGTKISEVKEGLSKVSKFDLEFTFREQADGISLELTYDTDLFEEAEVQSLLHHFEVVLHHAIQTPSRPVRDLEYLSQEEREQLLEQFNDTSVRFDDEPGLIGLFEKQVRKTPMATALVFGKEKLSYQELSDVSDQLAQCLVQQVQPKALIGIELGRGLAHVTALLAVLKAGAAFVPINTGLPSARASFIADGCELVIDQAYYDRFIARREQFAAIPPPLKYAENSLCYVMYTSGTGGVPKGVMISHGNLLNTIQWFIRHFETSEDTVSIQLTETSFDPSLEELFGTIGAGGVHHIIPKALLLDEGRLRKYIHDQAVTILNYVPNFLHNLLSPYPKIESLKTIIAGGEPLPEHVKTALLSKGYRLYNNYGPTEVTIDCLSAPMEETSPVTIGQPIANTKVYVLDHTHRLVPIGKTGKLYISGKGVAQGYLHDDELTRQKFVDNPYIDGGLMYDTGDLVRWLPSGQLEFIGRDDFQVKIRGYRVELQEIEACIQRFSSALGQVVVTHAKLGGQEVLQTYYTTAAPIDPQGLKRYLLEVLPDYMVPGYFMELDGIPVNANGKTDIGQLPPMSSEHLIRGTYVAPRSPLEQQLADLWSEILEIENIGIKDNFFEIGGHSLLVAKVINRIYKLLGKQIEYKDFFSAPTIEEVAGKLVQATFEPIQKTAQLAGIPLTPSQKRIWVLDQLEENTVKFNMPTVVKLKGQIDAALLETSFGKIIQRHDIMRAAFRPTPEGDVTQIILPFDTQASSLVFMDYSGSQEQAEQVKSYIDALCNLAFDLSKGMLFKAVLIRLSDVESVFCMNVHHIISDGWSMELLIAELIDAYKGERLPQLSIQYQDYALWLAQQLHGEKYKTAEKYWLQQFEGELPLVDLPNDHGRPALQTSNGKLLTRKYSQGFLDRLYRCSEAHGATLFMTLMAGVNALLHKYTYQSDIIIGTPTAGREHPDLENQLGIFLNTLAIRSKISKQRSFSELLVAQRQTLLQAYQYQYYPFDLLLGQLDLKRDTGRSALFDIMVVLQNQNKLGGIANADDLSSLVVDSYEVEKTTSLFDISFIFQEQDGLLLTIEFNTDIYRESFIDNIFGHLECLLEDAMSSPEKALAQVEYLTVSERQRIKASLEGIAVNPRPASLKQRFEQQAAETPDHIALTYEGRQMTYRTLNERANRFARFLIDRYEVGAGDFVGLKLKKGESLLVALLGIFKTTATYVPLDVDYPEERTHYIQADSTCKLLIDEDVFMAFETEVEESPISADNIDRSPDLEDIAYVIYTSGSTGRPKGVKVLHRNLGHFLDNIHQRYGFSENTKQPFIASPAFDISIFQLFAPLLAGGVCQIVDKERFQDLSGLMELLRESTVLDTVPAVYEMMANYIIEHSMADHFLGIEKIFIGGDRVPSALLTKLKEETFKKATIIVTYGPTEGTVFCTDMVYAGEIGDAELHGAIIGKPMANVGILLLDDTHRPVGHGIAGEIGIVGSGVTDGYLNRQELTDEKFINLPEYGPHTVYRTGDMGKMHPDGRIEFLGRKDDQVKIRGYRIELGEVEQVCTTIEAVTEVVVLPRIDGSQESELTAFYKADEAIPKGQWQEVLLQKLPEYMVPAHFVHLWEFPLTANLKVDKKALASMEIVQVTEENYVGPENETEEQLIEIFAAVLQKDKTKVGIYDNFFDLGGNSLKLIKAAAQIRERMRVELSTVALFKYPNIKTLSDYLSDQITPVQAVANDIDTSEYMDEELDLFDE